MNLRESKRPTVKEVNECEEKDREASNGGERCEDDWSVNERDMEEDEDGAENAAAAAVDDEADTFAVVVVFNNGDWSRTT